MKTFKHIIKNIVLVLFLGFSIPLSAQQTPVKPDKDLEKLINKGLSAYDRANYEDAELSFRKALAKDPLNAVASYNLGLTETELDKNLEAAHFFEKAAKTANDASLKSKAYFNQGNVWYQKKKYEKAIEAYKNALRQNPEDEEARYNLALAQMKLKKQQKKNKKNNKKNKQNKQNKNQQNKQNQKKDQKNKDQKNKDQKNKDQKNKNNKGQNKKDQQKKKGDQKNKDQNKKDQKNKDKNGKGDQKKDDKGKPKDDKQNKQGKQKDQQKQQNGKNGKKQQQPKQGEGQKRKVKLTPQQVKQLLVALKNKEQKTQKKVKAKILKGRGTKHKQDKDW